jgi:hypothetical protein
VTGTLGQDHPIENLLELDGDVYVIDEVEGYWVSSWWSRTSGRLWMMFSG